MLHYLMFISSAKAHGLLGGDDSPGHHGPLFLISIAVVVILLLVAEKRWKKRKSRMNKLNQGNEEKSENFPE